VLHRSSREMDDEEDLRLLFDRADASKAA
jgi:hypothetical protein